MKKRFLSMMLLTLVGVWLLAGCNAATKSSTGSDADKTTAESNKSSEAKEKDVFLEATLNIDVAASLKNSMTEIVELYNKKQPNITIRINADSSGTLQNQIEESAGTDVDMFFSASTKQMNKLKEEGYINEDSVSNLLKNEVVLISAKGSGTKVTGFDNITEAKSFALAGESVPVGQYSRQIFNKLGINEAINKMEINQCDNVSAVKDAVAEGSNEVGTVYYSDYYSVKDKVDLIARADESWCDPIVYPVGLVNNKNADDNQRKAAEDFINFLNTDEAKTVFEKYMFMISK